MRYRFGVVVAVSLLVLGLIAMRYSDSPDTLIDRRRAPVEVVDVTPSQPPVAQIPRDTVKSISQVPQKPTMPGAVANASKLPEPASGILSEFLAPSDEFPPGRIVEVKLNNIFDKEKRSVESDAIARRFRAILNDIPGLDMKLVDQGLECRQSLCRLIGGVDSSASLSNASSAIMDVQKISSENLNKAGIDKRMLISFHGSNFIAFYQMKP